MKYPVRNAIYLTGACILICFATVPAAVAFILYYIGKKVDA